MTPNQIPPIVSRTPRGREALKWSIALVLGGILLFVLSAVFEAAAIGCTGNSPIAAYNGSCDGTSFIAGLMAVVSVVSWIAALVMGIISAITWERKR